MNDKASAALARSPWSAQSAFLSYGLRLGVRVNHAGLLPRILETLPPQSQPIEPGVVDHWFSLYQAEDGRFTIGNGATPMWRDVEERDVFHLLEAEIQIHVAEWAQQRIFVHAGVVGWRGRALLLPGRSFSGKSTLVASLLQAGATYYSDEYAVLDEHGTVFSYPRRLALRRPDRSRDRRCEPEELGSTAGSQPLKVGLVAVAHYKAGESWQPRRLSPGQALLELLGNTVSMQRQPGPALAPLLKIAQQAPTLKGLRGEADSTADALLNQISS